MRGVRRDGRGEEGSGEGRGLWDEEVQGGG